MELKDLAVDMFDEDGVPSVIIGGDVYTEKVQTLKPIEKGLGRITNQTLFLTGKFINKAVIGGIDDKGQNFAKEFVYIGGQSVMTGSAKKEMPKDEYEKFREYIARHNWRDAKTYAQFSPHQYILSFPCWKLKADGKCPQDCERCKKERAEFEHWVMFIREYGEKVVYGRNNYVCLRVDDKHYWTQGEVIDTTWVLNRAITNDPRYKVPMRWVEREE